MSLNLPVAAPSGRSVCLRTKVVGGEDPAGLWQCHRGEPFPKSVDSGFPAQKQGLRSVSGSSLSLLHSWAHSARTIWFRRDRGPPPTGPELPGFSPRPAQKSFQKLDRQVKIRGSFLLLSLGCMWGYGEMANLLQLYSQDTKQRGPVNVEFEGAGGAMSPLFLCPISRQ